MLRILALSAFAAFVALGCQAAAQAPLPLPVTAGPAEDIILAPGESRLLSLELATDPAAVDQTVGLILPAGRPVLVSAQVLVSAGVAVTELVIGDPHGPDEWQPVAWSASGVIAPVIIWPEPGQRAALRVTSTVGAEIIAGGGDGSRRSWVTSIPVDPLRPDAL